MSLDAGEIRGGFLDDPLKDWPNDDLLLGQDHRAFVQRRVPDVALIFDWPELRELFARHDTEANKARRGSRGLGLAAVWLGLAGLCLTAASPVVGRFFPQPVIATSLGGAAAFLAVASGLIGYSQVLSGRQKLQWLSHRFWTERLRQLHFQLIINNLPLAARVAEDPNEADAWRTMRARELDDFVHQAMEPISEALHKMERDLSENQPWLTRAWLKEPEAPKPGSGLDLVMEVLSRQRFGIQKRFCTFKLKDGLHSPRTRASMVSGASDALTLVAMVCSATVGVLLALGAKTPDMPVISLIAAGGVCAAVILALRVLDEGLQLRSETERYSWYLAAVEALSDRFETGDLEAKILALREMELLSYQELRRFTFAFQRARFVM